MNNRKLYATTVNINGLSDRSTEALYQFMNDNDIHITCVTETKRETSNCSDFPGYTAFHENPSENPSQSGGILLLIQKIMCPNQVKFNGENKNSVWATCNLNGSPLTIGGFYCRPNNSLEIENTIKEILQGISFSRSIGIPDFILLGDFNARHPTWGDKSNSQGETLSNFLEEQHLFTLNYGEPTFTSIGDGRSTIDLIICNENLKKQSMGLCIDEFTEMFTGAPNRGHYPVIASFDLKTEDRIKITKNLDKTDWTLWRETLEDRLEEAWNEIEQASTGKQLWEITLRCLQQASKETIPTKQVSKHSKPYFTDELKSLSADLREARKRLKKRSDPINSLAYEKQKTAFQDALLKAKARHFQESAEKLNKSTGIDFWKAKKLFAPNGDTIPMGCLASNGKILKDEASKFKHLFDVFFSGNHLNNSQFDEQWRKTVENEQKCPLSPESCDSFNKQITATELESALKMIQTSGKSEDPDGLHPLMLKHAGGRFKCTCLKLFNICFTSGDYIWKKGKVIFLRKPNKEDYHLAGSFRPITLTSYIGKLFERILEHRLRQHLEKSRLIDDSQEGFRKKRGSGRYIYRLIDHLQNVKDNNETAAALFIDLEKAFDSIWIDGMLYKLRIAGIRGTMYNAIDDFLRNRYVTISLGTKDSDPFKPTVGLPQGSILSPILFILYIADIFDGCNGKSFKYADDATSVAKGKTIEQAVGELSKDCEAITRWLRKWRLRISGTKTEVVIFKKGEVLAPSFKVSIQGHQIKYATQSTALGIIIDNKLTFKTQLEKSTNKAKAAFASLRPIIQNPHVTPFSSSRLIKMLVIPVWTYLSHIWANPIWYRGDKLWYKMLSASCGTVYNHSLAKMEVLGNFTPIDIEIMLSQAKFVHKYSTANDSCGAALRNSDSRINNIIHASHRNFLRVTGNDQGAEYTKHVCSVFRKEEWRKRLVNTWPDYPSGNTGIPVFPKRFSKSSTKLAIEMLTNQCNLNDFQYTIWRTASPLCICGTEETSNHYIFHCRFYRNLRKNSIHFDSFQDLLKDGKERDWYELATFIEESRRFKP